MDTFVIAFIAIVAFAAVLVPLMRRGTRSTADQREFAISDDDVAADEATASPMRSDADVAVQMSVLREVSDDAIEREVLRYRAALRAGTLCPRCGQANPADSAFCSDCGRKLPLADAKEFE